MTSITIPKAPSKSINDIHKVHEDLLVDFGEDKQYAVLLPSWHGYPPLVFDSIEATASQCSHYVSLGLPPPTVLKADGTFLEYVQRESSELKIYESEGKLVDCYIDIDNPSINKDFLESRILT
jgi:hypothetical protein